MEIPRIQVDEDTFLDACNIVSGAFFPLGGFLSRDDYRAVVDDMHLKSGQPWTIPINLAMPEGSVAEATRAGQAHLEFGGRVVGSVFLEDVYEIQPAADALKVFGTVDERHPGVSQEMSRSRFRAGGSISLDETATLGFERYELTPQQARDVFRQKGWRTVVGFQTRNSIHRAHEYLQRVALEYVDGLFLHPLIGWKKGDDFTPLAVVRSYETMIEAFYPEDRVALGVLSTAMRYAGPREAVFHALVRRNFGCTHFIVGRDHAGVGSYYGLYEAQELCARFNDLGIEILNLNGPYHCARCGGVVTRKTCKHDDSCTTDISGTQIRSAILNGELPSEKLMRREISRVLVDLHKQGKCFNVQADV